MIDFNQIPDVTYSTFPIINNPNFISYNRPLDPNDTEKQYIKDNAPQTCAIFAENYSNKHPQALILNCGYNIKYSSGRTDNLQINNIDKYHFFIIDNDQIIDPIIFLNIAADSIVEGLGKPTEIKYFIHSKSTKIIIGNPNTDKIFTYSKGSKKYNQLLKKLERWKWL